MLFLWLIQIVIALVGVVVGILPTANLDPNVTANLTSAGNALASVNVILPVGTLLTILVAMLTLESIIFGYKIIMCVIKRIPGQS